MRLRTCGHDFALPIRPIKYEFNKRNFIVCSLFNYVWFYLVLTRNSCALRSYSPWSAPVVFGSSEAAEWLKATYHGIHGGGRHSNWQWLNRYSSAAYCPCLLKAGVLCVVITADNDCRERRPSVKCLFISVLSYYHFFISMPCEVAIDKAGLCQLFNAR